MTATKIQVAFGRVDADVIPVTRRPLYTYLASEPVAVGDVVLVPANWAAPEPREATVVTTMGGDYDGPLVFILRVVERAASP